MEKKNRKLGTKKVKYIVFCKTAYYNTNNNTNQDIPDTTNRRSGSLPHICDNLKIGCRSSHWSYTISATFFYSLGFG